MNLNGIAAPHLLKALAARLRAGKCDGRTLEDEDRLAQACIAAGLRKEINNVLKHLLDPLKHRDGPKPKRRDKAKIWDERRVVARRVADLLHAMGIHLRGVPFASYEAVKAARRVKEDDRKQEAEEAKFKAGLDDIEEEEPKAKRPKRSCRTKTRRGGST